MGLFPLNKTLLWKEWRQNRWLLLLLLLFITFTPFIEAVIFWAGTMLGMNRFELFGLHDLFGCADPWSFKVTEAIKGLRVAESPGSVMDYEDLRDSSIAFNPLFEWAPVAVWLWGILLIARERTPNTLEFWRRHRSAGGRLP